MKIWNEVYLVWRWKGAEHPTYENMPNPEGGRGGASRYRVTMLPASQIADLNQHLVKVRAMFEDDRHLGLAGVWMPDALAAKYPSAGQAWGWHWVLFPSGQLSRDPRTLLER